MTYRFSGFLVKDKELQVDSASNKNHITRKIDDPFKGSGLCISSSNDVEPSREELDFLIKYAGLTKSDNWIYLNYVCWGGSIDSVFGYVNYNGILTGPIEETNLDKVTDTYVKLMSDFGVSEESALDFPPFYRGFWGEQ